MADEYLTLQEAAEALGVHYMTAYRYVRLGLLPASKVGASWRVDREDLDRFSTDEGAVVGRGRQKPAPWTERLESRLRAGDELGAWGVIEAALASGANTEDVYLDLIAPAMIGIGEAWARGEVDVSVEHRASAIVLRLLGRLSPRFSRRGRSRGSVVLGGAPGDLHGLPVAILADVVRSAGFSGVDLGANLPARSFVQAARDADRLIAVGVSASTEGNDRAVASAIDALHAALGDSIPVLVGGSAVRDERHALSLGADCWALDGRMLVARLEEIAARR